jgi:hypothetical protein
MPALPGILFCRLISGAVPPQDQGLLQTLTEKVGSGLGRLRGRWAFFFFEFRARFSVESGPGGAA